MGWIHYPCLMLALALALAADAAKSSIPLRKAQRSQKNEWCSPCLPGYGLVQECNATHSTVCEPCLPGYWTPKRSHREECAPCSKCAPKLYISQPCTMISDTVCDSCRTTNGHLNIDFTRKCLNYDQAEEPLADEPDQELRYRTKINNIKAIPLKIGKPAVAPRGRSAALGPEPVKDPHEFWQGEESFPDGLQRNQHPIIKPSTQEDYPNDVRAVLHAQRRKMWILIAACGVMGLMTFGVLVFFTHQFCRHRSDTRLKTFRVGQYRPLQDYLTDSDQQLIGDAARSIQEREEKETQKRLKSSLSVQVNPLERLLDGSDVTIA